tara:strand:+ start:11027 stop:11869 length:843 start_codon:yes stop_codon:yes gene_type:complete
MNYNSQAGQDKFVVNVLNGKKNGYFLEIGSAFPIRMNNTYILENLFLWEGIMIENGYDKALGEEGGNWLEDYKKLRKKSKHVIEDATKIDYKNLLKDYPKNFDYLQIDIEAKNGSTIKTLEKLDSEIMDKYKFAVITFEHDYYAAGKYKYTREKSREIFKKRGYFMVFGDINCGDPNFVFEDWWVHPSLVNMDYVMELKNENYKNYKKNHLVDVSINWKDIYYPREFKMEDIYYPREFKLENIYYPREFKMKTRDYTFYIIISIVILLGILVIGYNRKKK